MTAGKKLNRVYRAKCSKLKLNMDDYFKEKYGVKSFTHLTEKNLQEMIDSI